MQARDPRFDHKLAAIFRAEAAEHVQRMQECLAQLDTGAAERDQAIALIYRAAHSLKGAARAVGQGEVETVCHAAEGLLAGLQRGRLEWSPSLADALHDLAEGLEQSLREPSSARLLLGLTAQLNRLERGPGADAAPSAPAAEPPRAAPGGAGRAPAGAPTQPAPGGAAAAGPGAAASPPPAVATQSSEPTVRVPVERLESLLFQAQELVTARLDAQLRRRELHDVLAAAAGLRRAALAEGGELALAWRRHEQQLRGLATMAERDLRQFTATTEALLGEVKTTLLQRGGALRPLLAATVRELARSQDKDVELRFQGEDVQIDRRLLEALREPLLHLLRNAVCHGVERPSVRAAAGKPQRGVLEFGIAQRAGGRVEITLSDDGAGIDTAALAQAARALRLAVPEHATRDEILALVFESGLSTAAEVTEVAGRGIGLPIVRETVERLGGTLSVASEPGQGTRFTASLPLSLATFQAIEVRACGHRFLLPTHRVQRCFRLAPDQVRTVGGAPAVPFEAEDLPLASLCALLQLPAAQASLAIDCVVLSAGPRRVALAVEEVVGEQEVLGKPVEPSVSGSRVLTGAAVVANGELVQILNVPELVRMALREGGRAPVELPAFGGRASRRKVLVVEDSITSRTLLRNVLELGGHEVEVAVDGADALQKLHDGGFDLVVSDVEMPNLDGIGLTEAIRRDPHLAKLPVVLVTSLASPGDRERGAEAGANAYIVKSSFEQGDLLRAVTELA